MPVQETRTEARLARIRELLQRALAPERLEIRDDGALHVGHRGAGGGGHFAIEIRSARFYGHSPLARHRMVYAALKDMMPADIHALSIQADTPEKETGTPGGKP